MNPYDQTEAEQSLLELAQRRLGVNLATFLLAGLGEPRHSRRQYIVQGGLPDGRAVTYHLEVVSEDGRGVPAERDPLVLAAMLHVLLTSRTARDEITFRDEDLLTKLDWDDTPQARPAIASAVERYFSTTYYLQRADVRGPNRTEVRYSQVQKLITGYETTTVRLPGSTGVARKSTVVHFSSGFIEEVATPQKYFLGIDFERLERLQPLPQGA